MKSPIFHNASAVASNCYSPSRLPKLDQATIYILLAGALGLFMAWGIGANDVANAMATSIGSKALTIKQAVVIAAIFEFSGAFLAGGQVTSTIRKGIIDSSAVA